MTAAICGLGVVGGFGHTVAELEQTLGGQPVVPTPVAIPVGENTITVPCLTADLTPLAEFVPTRVMRRMSPYIRLGLLAAFQAMADADVLDPVKRGRMGIIVATGQGATGNNYNFLYPFEDKEEVCGSPTRFSNSVHNAAAAYIAIALSEMGPNHSITQEDISFPSALLTAHTWLQQGRVDCVLVGGMDELNHAYAYAWHRHQKDRGAASKMAPPPAGEGACFFVLRPEGAPPTPYGLIRETRMGRMLGRLPDLPPHDWIIVGQGGVAATVADYTPWIGADTPWGSYAHIYGDLSVDSAFDTAIAAIGRKNGLLYGPDPQAPDDSEARVLTPEARIACIKLGVGETYGWSIIQ